MEGPGVSLFQGSEMLKLNASIPEEDDAEALEDEKRRNDELRDLLSSAFDDLHVDDNDESFASSGQHLQNDSVHSNDDGNILSPIPRIVPEKNSNGLAKSNMNGIGSMGDTALSAHYQHCFHNGQAYSGDTSDRSSTPPPASGDAGQLPVLYGVRMREIARLQQQLEITKLENHTQVDQLKRRMILLEAEKEAAVKSRNDAQSLIVDEKEQMSDLLKELGTLKRQNKNLETSKEELERELSLARASIQDLQNKVIILETGSVHHMKEKQADLMLRTLQERHHKEVLQLQEQLVEIREKFNSKESELKNQDKRIWELTRSHESMLMERVETVNRLARALEESQRHVQELVADKESPGLAEALQAKEAAEEKLKKLKKELERVQDDVQQFESMISLGVINGESDSFTQLRGNKNRTKGSIAVDDLVQQLRDELTRSIKSQQLKRVEIKKLTEELQAKDKEIRDMKEQELKFKAQVVQFQVDSERIMNEVKTRVSSQPSQIELNQLRRKVEQLENSNSELQRQNEELTEKVVEMQCECDEEKLRVIENHSDEYLAFHHRAVASARQAEQEKAEAALNELKVLLEQAKKEVEEVKIMYTEVALSKSEMISELEQEKEMVVKLQAKLEKQKGKTQKLKSSTNTNVLEETNELQSEIEKRLHLQYEERISEAIEKAKQDMLRELEKEHEVLKNQANKEAEQEFEAKMQTRIDEAKREWQKQVPVAAEFLTSNQVDEQLHEEISQLKEELDKRNKAYEEVKIQHKEVENRMWGLFREELEKGQNNKEANTLNQLDAGTSTTNLTFPELKPTDIQVRDLENQLEEAKSHFASRLEELQNCLQEKHFEVEDFKNKVIEYTRIKMESQEKEQAQFVAALKTQIEVLTAELQENKKLTEEEKVKASEVLVAEMQGLKNKQKLDEMRIASMRKKLNSSFEKMAQLKEYYLHREKHIESEYKKREDQYFETLLKIKNEIDPLCAIDLLEFSKAFSDLPTNDS